VLATGLPIYFVRLVKLEAHCNIQSFYTLLQIFTTSTALNPMLIMRDSDFRLCLKDFLCNCCRQRIVGDSAASLQNQFDGIASSSTSVGTNEETLNVLCLALLQYPLTHHLLLPV